VPDRPESVPAEAWWSPEDNEWVLGPKDAKGRLHGVVRYWRPDGTLCCESELVAGQFHGPTTRYHETGELAQRAGYEAGLLHGPRTWFATDGVTTENMLSPGMSESIWKIEAEYRRGLFTGARCFDRAGVAVRSDGTPLPQRPPGVPPLAVHHRSGSWLDGTWTEQGVPVGSQRRYSASGILVGEEHHEDGQVIVTERRDDGSPRVRYARRNGVLDGDAEAWRRDGTPLVRAHFGETHAIEHLDRAGTVVRRSEYGPLPPPSSSPAPPEVDQRVLAAVTDGEPGAVEQATAMSPAGLAAAIARGWGGDDERDHAVARRFRRLVRRLATPSLAGRLAALELDRAPRLMTAARLDAAVGELGADPAVDPAALEAAFIAQGGAAIALSLRDPARAIGALEARITGTSLSLAHHALAELPPAIGRLLELRRIDASSNRLTTVPAELADLFALQELDLHANRVTSLPSELAWLPSLRILHLAENAMSSVPPAVFELAELQALGLGDNQLTDLPDAVADLTELHTLWLTRNPLRQLPRALTRLASLRFLHLGDHPFAEPPDVLAEMVSLEELWIASPSLERLPAAIVQLPRLRRLIVWCSGLTTVPDELFEARHLAELRITDNPLPPGTVERLREALPDCKIY